MDIDKLTIPQLVADLKLAAETAPNAKAAGKPCSPPGAGIISSTAWSANRFTMPWDTWKPR